MAHEIQARTEIPSLIDPPPGCPFAPRCPKVMDVCRKVMPGVEQVGPDHWVKCHLYGPGETQPLNTAATPGKIEITRGSGAAN